MRLIVYLSAIVALGCDAPGPSRSSMSEAPSSVQSVGAVIPGGGEGGDVGAVDFRRGELLSYACRACHALHADEQSPLGPNLSGVFGRRAGTMDFEYSAALRAADFVWTPAALDAWLAQPEEFISGNNMAFTGYQSAADRRDLIAYLLRETKDN